MKEYKICTNCIMDTTDSEIQFDDNGRCNHCRDYDNIINSSSYKKVKKPGELERIVAEIKEKGKNKKYDCIIGVSGGVDSTFVAYKVKQLGLRPLAVHLDNGWNSELAVSNIEKTMKRLDIDLYTYVIDWEEFRDLQLSFLKASIPDAERPTDHAILAILYSIASKEGVRYIMNGSNVSTEVILPRTWTNAKADWIYIKHIQEKFGSVKLKSFPHYTQIDLIKYKLFKKIEIINILDYFDYNKAEAMELIQKDLGWVYYGGKHYESVYTRFYQAYILPVKFNIDKRRAHLSNLICSGQITRDEALNEIQDDICAAEKAKEDKIFVIKKLGLNQEEFEKLMEKPIRSFSDYPTYANSFIYKASKGVYNILKKVVKA